MENKKGFSILKTVIIIICILFIAVSLAVNILFSKNKTPHIFGRYIYIAGDLNPMGNMIEDGSAILAADAADANITKGDVVICYPASDPTTLSLRSIYEVITAEDGSVKYATATSKGYETDSAIAKEQIVAVCTGNPISLELGKFIRFTLNIKGILLELILPCVILVIMLIVKIASSDVEEDDQDYDFYEYDEEEAKEEENRVPSHAKSGTPLFEPSQEIQPSNDFERKKMSIAENFSQKQVNPDSPYQKEKERTMQFKAQRSAAESAFAARNMGGQSSTAPTADALREEMLRKTAEAERTGSFNTKLYGQYEKLPNEAVTDNTGILSKSQLAEMARNDVPKTAPLRSPVSAAPAKKSSSPDIDDIISKSETNEKKKRSSDMSVDDLIKMIENEKNKL